MSEEGFAAAIEKNMGIFSYLNFLFHPSQPNFEDYTGAYPEGLREKLSGISQLASMVGYEVDFTANISATLNEMSGDQFFAMLYDPNVADDPDTPANESIRLDRDQFIALLGNDSIKEAFLAIATTSIGENPTLGSLLAFEGNTMDFSAFQHDGQNITAQPISSLNADTIAPFVNDLSNDATLAFLKSLPETSDDPDAITQATIVNMIAAGRDGENEGITIPAGTSIEDAIQMRVGNNDTWYTTESMVRGVVYDGIRASIETNLTDVIAKTNQDIASGDLISGLSPEDLYEMLSDKLNSEEGRAEIQTALADPENLELLRKNLAEMEFNTLMSLLPNGVVDAQISNGIRDFLNSNGLLQSIIGILHGVFEWMGGILPDSMAEKLNDVRDISGVLRPEAASAYQAEFGRAASPDGQPQPNTTPVVDPSATQDTAAPVVIAQPGTNVGVRN